MDNKKYKLLLEKIESIAPYISVETDGDLCRISGEVRDWRQAVEIGVAAQASGLFKGIVNDITLLGATVNTHLPKINNDDYDGKECDVLVIGGGVVGCAILRELTRYKLKAVLIEKENDVALAASSRNDGMVHVGADIKGNPTKMVYAKRGNRMFDRLCTELDVKFSRCGQYILFNDKRMRALMPILKLRVLNHGIGKFKILSRKKLLALEPNLSAETQFGIYFSETGIVCPYGLTVALAENAINNGAEVLLETAALDMHVNDGNIEWVSTNRGKLYPKVVVNAAGVYCDKVAEMAGDRFFTVHARKGSSLIMDKTESDATTHFVVAMLNNRIKSDVQAHTKGGGIVVTVDGNLLVGPSAKEVYDREDCSVDIDELRAVYEKQRSATPSLKMGGAITYFSGIRASTYEEDFIIEKGRRTRNIVHAAGIQSPGLTAAPAIGVDVARMAVEELADYGVNAMPNDTFNPIRKGIVRLNELPLYERDELIKRNPDYGKIVCRCEGISKGEIIDALNSTLPPKTVDGVKRRVRAGMGRCQGGFCQPLVLQLMKEHYGVEYTDISKKGDGKIIVETK